MSATQSQTTTHAGGCHCGAIRFEAELTLDEGLSRCNCTWCTKRGGTTAIVKPDAFRLLAGEKDLGDYAWGAKNGNFLFCKHCGVHVFGRGNLDVLGGAYVGVNANCIDGVDPAAMKVVYFDGRHDNWMAGPRETPWPVMTL